MRRFFRLEERGFRVPRRTAFFRSTHMRGVSTPSNHSISPPKTAPTTDPRQIFWHLTACTVPTLHSALTSWSWSQARAHFLPTQTKAVPTMLLSCPRWSCSLMAPRVAVKVSAISPFWVISLTRGPSRTSLRAGCRPPQGWRVSERCGSWS